MIVVMYGLYRDIEVGDIKYESVSPVSWECWNRFFRWAFEQRLGVPSYFQGGWAIEVQDEQ